MKGAMWSHHTLIILIWKRGGQPLLPMSHAMCVCTSCTMPRIGFLPAPLTAASRQGGRLRAWKDTQGGPKPSSHRDLEEQENFILQKPVLYLANLLVKWGKRWVLEPEQPRLT